MTLFYSLPSGSRPGPQLAVRASKGDTPDDIPEYFRTEVGSASRACMYHHTR